MVHLHEEGRRAARGLDWEVPVLTTVAATGVGVDELHGEIARHRAALEATGALEGRRQARRAEELRALVLGELRRRVDDALEAGGPLAPVLADVESGRVDVYTALARALERLPRTDL
jgi:LAO/AO transport system kinase